MTADNLAPEVQAALAGHGIGADTRNEARVPLKFKVAIVYHQHEDKATRPTFHGRTHDISTQGLSIVVDQNVFNEADVTVLLAIPPAHVGMPQKIIEATARMVYTVFSSEHDAFRIGLTFGQFKRNGREFLNAIIDQRRISSAYRRLDLVRLSSNADEP
jgi:c-di-GMP-binding flagellar brake protein YcgR